MATKLKLPSLQEMLEDELERLKRKLSMGYELNVAWLPNNNSKLSGEVKGKTIFIYEEDFDKALETLKHEFWITLFLKLLSLIGKLLIV